MTSNMFLSSDSSIRKKAQENLIVESELFREC